MMSQVTVRVLKYDGAVHRQWPATIARRDESVIVLDAEFTDDVEHDLLGVINRGTRTIEYYWFDRWYNVFRFLESDGKTKLFYCNVSMPPSLKHGTLTYIDLDIDILVRPDGSFAVLDQEEFDVNASVYNYPDEVKRQARLALDELISMIKTRQFPFDDLNPIVNPA